MLKSMTAYGRSHLVNSVGRFTVEIQSVNRKFLEVDVNLPSELSRFELEIKKLFLSKVVRGKVSIKIYAWFDEIAPLNVMPNISLARQIKQAWQILATELNISPSQDLDLNMLMSQPRILLYDENLGAEEIVRAVLIELIEKALDPFLKMKIAEGQHLAEDIQMRLDVLQASIEAIAAQSENAVSKYTKKLKERLEEVLAGVVENEERVLREICLFGEKVDIVEEITRFSSHLKQFQNLLYGSQEGVGKTMEFILQELNREINTIGSKTPEVSVSHLVVEVKSELERIREQIQNIE